MAELRHVQAFYESHCALYDHLIATGELSFAADMNVTFCRSLVLAIASYFEHEVTAVVRQVPVVHAYANPMIVSMIERQVIARKYHTWFDWDGLKPGPFFGLFGEMLKARMSERFKREAHVTEAVNAFLELGQLRNKLVHQNYVEFSIQKTPAELFGSFKVALGFLAFIRGSLLPSTSPRKTKSLKPGKPYWRRHRASSYTVRRKPGRAPGGAGPPKE